MASNENENRRQVSSRNVTFFHTLSKKLVGMGLHPNHISVMSAVFGIIAGAAFWAAGATDQHVLYCIIAILGIQLRLVCNLIDGLMAVEGGLKTPTGEIYNDLPDRISDAAILVGFGFGAQTGMTAMLGWAAAVGAIMTAYIRVLGASMGAGHFFAGPMAKQHRMFLLTLAALIWIVERSFAHSSYSVFFTLLLVILGTFATCVRRLRLIASKLK